MNQLEGHTTRRYDAELTHAHLLVLELGGLVIDQLGRALKSLEEKDAHAATDVTQRDHTVSELGKRVDDEIVRVIARRGPVAKDLRAVIGMSKVVAALGQVEREIIKVAQTVIYFFHDDTNSPSNEMFHDIDAMGRAARRRLRYALDVFDQCNLDRAEEVLATRGELTTEFPSGLRRLTTFILEDARTIGHVIHIVLAIKSLEGIGEYAINICEYVIYQVTGEDVRQPSTANENRKNKPT